MSARRTPLLTSLAACAALALAAPSAARAAALVRVPQDAATLDVALGKVPDGGAVELAAGTYVSPPNGFAIRNAGRGFMVRAAAGATVVLDGGGSRSILRFINSNRTRGKRVTFERLAFRGGYNDNVNEGGAVTISKADALFRQVSFLDNRVVGPTGGGAVKVLEGSEASFVDCSFRGNSARLRGGAVVVRGSLVSFLRGEMVGNRTNLPGHDPHSFGGAIMVLDGALRVTGTRFEGNEAGWVGGAIYAIGNYGVGADLQIADASFIANQALPDACCAIADPTGGGAIHVEDQTTLRIHRSAFVRNRADIGAAVDGFRASVEVYGSVFQQNGLPAGHRGGMGGAIAVMSSDSADASTAGGAINRPPGRLVVTRSLLQGVGGLDGAPWRGGCILGAGDGPRLYGGNGVPQAGTPAENRATVEIRGSVLSDCDAGLDNAGNAGFGGGIFGDLVELLVEDSMVIDSDARGGGSGGGAIGLYQQSHARLVRTSFARDTAAISGGTSGGTLWSDTSPIEQTDVRFLGNASGVREGRLVAVPAPSSVGAAPTSLTASTLGYAWTGGSANVNGFGLGQRSGLLEVGPGDFNLTIDGGAAAASKVLGTCTAGPFLCLNGNRFRAEVSFVVNGERRTAQAVSLTGDTGAFWFFDPANVELIVKELDGRGLNGNFWTFFGALTNLEHTLTITDTATGVVRVYQNPAGKFASAGDTSAFAGAAGAAAAASAFTTASDEASVGEPATIAALPALAPAASCAPTATSLCLSGSRIRVEVTWRDFAGHTGVGHAVALSGDTGYFWFSSAANVEVVTKVLDARGVNGQYWFFYGALSNVEYTLTITDVPTGRRKSYTNPINKFGSLGDTAALPSS
ncbi:MAG TPA: hypothetical protein VGS57_05645 [Thermoanaerobaculia bacterium]|nr:hypothetical protein [Thermoanaerobaculia bacterium]